MKVEFIDSQRSEHGVQPVLQVLQGTPAEIAPSTYYAAKTRPISARTVRDRELTTVLERVHAENYDAYGARKMWHGTGPWHPAYAYPPSDPGASCHTPGPESARGISSDR